MDWDSFIWFALTASFLWISGAIASVVSKRGTLAGILTGCGSVVFMTFIAGVWISLGRPPLRTMGETRLWFSLFLSLVGLGVHLRWRYRWVLPFGCLMAVMFACINVFKPEIHTEELMPALRSPWFVPHVIVYMFAYAVMGIATILAVRLLWLSRKPVTVVRQAHQPRQVRLVRQAHQPHQPHQPVEVTDLRLCDTLVRIGWGFLTMGIVMGALWAKQAWGDYWTWDPKETWAAATWLGYLLYLHLRQGQGCGMASHTPPDSLPPVTLVRQAHQPVEVTSPNVRSIRRALSLLIFSFLLLQMCWWGVNYLPSAQGFSLHTY